jgi:prepilin-type N-terminal cleavage/methylation domain-containing protein/prepilin-type processing-associated H-X9-DG protein
MKSGTCRSVVFNKGRSLDRGFSLVELLVVILIIAVIAAISVLAIRKVRERARIVSSISSMRQVASFHLAYSTENQGDINTSGGTDIGPAGQKHFWGRFQPYFLPTTEATQGPAQKEELIRSLNPLLNTTNADTMADTAIAGPKIFHDQRGMPVPFSFNKNVYSGAKLKKITEFGDHSRMIYAVYGRFNFTEADGSAFVPRPMDGTIPTNRIFYTDDRKAIASFLDGHVEIVSPPFPDHYYHSSPANP